MLPLRSAPARLARCCASDVVAFVPPILLRATIDPRPHSRAPAPASAIASVELRPERHVCKVRYRRMGNREHPNSAHRWSSKGLQCDIVGPICDTLAESERSVTGAGDALECREEVRRECFDDSGGGDRDARGAAMVGRGQRRIVMRAWLVTKPLSVTAGNVGVALVTSEPFEKVPRFARDEVSGGAPCPAPPFPAYRASQYDTFTRNVWSPAPGTDPRNPRRTTCSPPTPRTPPAPGSTPGTAC